MSDQYCSSCKECINPGDEYLKVGNSSYHVNHFQCNICTIPLTGKKFYSKDDHLWCQLHYEEKYCQKCNGCNKYIISGSVLKALDLYFHPEHFCCSYQPCSKKLDAQYFQRDGLPYCILHAVANTNLNITINNNTPIVETKEENNVATPPSLPLNNCELCSLPVIENEICYLGSKLYHTTCLSCFHCSASLSKSGSHIFKKDNHLYCKRDYSNLFLKLCTSCGNLITDMCVSTNDEFYHSDCFICSVPDCKLKLDVYSSNFGELRCPAHLEDEAIHNICSVCENIMNEEIVPVAGKRIHPECLVCSFCNCELTKINAKLSGGRLACVTCATSDKFDDALKSPLSSRSSMIDPKSPNFSLNVKTPDINFKSPSTQNPNPLSHRPPSLNLNIKCPFQQAKSPMLYQGREKSDSATKLASINLGNSLPSLTPSSSDPSSLTLNTPVLNPRNPAGSIMGPNSSNNRTPSSRQSVNNHNHTKSSIWDGRDRSSIIQDNKIKWTKGQLIGKGSFGKVYMGLNAQTGQLLAIKQVQLNNDEDVEQALSLQTEISLMEKLRHPNIVSLLGSERESDKFNIIMEYVPGKALDQLLETFGVLNVNTIRRYTRQLLSALKYLHANGVVHRDIKGKNILVDATGNCKLCDFGSAKQFADILSKAAPSIGYNYTPLWTAPEVLLGNYGRKVDIWSLGCVIIEMATAKPPWSECNFSNPFRALYHIGNTDSIPLIPEWFSQTPLLPDGETPIGVDFLKKCFERDPDKRPDAADLILHPFVNDVGYESEEDDAEYQE